MSAEETPKYRKISKQRGSMFRVTRLWVASDHLLLVSSAFAFESYRRFYFRDIQALIVRPTKVRRTWLIVNGICLALFGSICVALALSSQRNTSVDSGSLVGFAVISGIIGSVFLIGFFWQLIRGPSCVVHLQMPNGLAKLEPLDRLRPALKARDRVVRMMAERAGAG